MEAFGRFLKSKRPITLANGATFVLKDIVGGMGRFVQTKYPTANGGGVVPDFVISSPGGLYSTIWVGNSFWLNLDSQALSALYTEYQTTLAIDAKPAPVDMTEAAESIAYLNAAVVTLKSILSMG